jgi:Domain of unknown function (DUF4382)
MVRLLTSRSLVFVAVLTLTGLLACGGSTTPTEPSNSATSSSSGSSGGGPGGGSSNTGNGSLAINITDSPFSDAKALLVTFSDVKVHNADSDSWQTIPFASGSSRTCDLKKLQGPVDVLGIGTLPAGHYTQIRLVVSSANIYFDNASTGPACAPSIAAPAGSSASVDVPSGEVILNRQFTITSSATTMLLDFDGDQSVKQTGNGNTNGHGNSNTKYIMTPVIAIVSVQ